MAQINSLYKVEDGEVLQSFVENITSQKPEFSIDLSLFKQGAAITRAVNNKLRQRILYTLHKKGLLTVTELRSEICIVQSKTSTHLKILRDVDFVIAHREGQNIYYSINYKRFQEVQALLQQINKVK